MLISNVYINPKLTNIFKQMAKQSTPTAKVKESDRSKKLSTLETTEEVQKDIQAMYSSARKIVAKIKDVNATKLASHILEGMRKNVTETNNIDNMVYSQILQFWHNAYSLNEQIINLSTK